MMHPYAEMCNWYEWQAASACKLCHKLCTTVQNVRGSHTSMQNAYHLVTWCADGRSPSNACSAESAMAVGDLHVRGHHRDLHINMSV